MSSAEVEPTPQAIKIGFGIAGLALAAIAITGGVVAHPLSRAVELARDQRARSLELRALTTLAKLHRGTSGFESAHASLTIVYGQFTEGLELPDLREARAILTRG